MTPEDMTTLSITLQCLAQLGTLQNQFIWWISCFLRECLSSQTREFSHEPTSLHVAFLHGLSVGMQLQSQKLLWATYTVLLNALAFLLRGRDQTRHSAPAKYFRLYVIPHERKRKALNHVSVLLRNLTVAFGFNVCICLTVECKGLESTFL